MKQPENAVRQVLINLLALLVVSLACCLPLRVSAQSVPFNVGHINNGGSATGVAVVSNFCYLANSSDGVRIYDVSDPANPVNVGHINDGVRAFRLAVSGNYVYVADNYYGLRIYDVSDPASPVSVAFVRSLASGVAVSGNFVYTADTTYGLNIYDISDPTHPVVVYHSNASYFNVSVCGDYAYAASTYTLHIYNITNPPNAFEVGVAPVSGSAVAVLGNYAYVGGNGLWTLDISDPAHPFQVGSRVTNYNAWSATAAYGVVVSGKYAYVAQSGEGFCVDDLSNPTKPVNVGFVRNGGTATGVAVSGNYAYLANGTDGLRIYALGVPATPKLSFSQYNPDLLLCTWPSNSAGFAIEQNFDLKTTNWTIVVSRVASFNGMTKVYMQVPASNAFYRLKFPPF